MFQMAPSLLPGKAGHTHTHTHTYAHTHIKLHRQRQTRRSRMLEILLVNVGDGNPDIFL